MKRGVWLLLLSLVACDLPTGGSAPPGSGGAISSPVAGVQAGAPVQAALSASQEAPPELGPPLGAGGPRAGHHGPASGQPGPPRAGAPGAGGLDSEQLAQLQSLGYLAGYEPPPAQVGVVKHDAARAYDGLNFYTSGHSPTATLMTMDGEVVHTWSQDYLVAFPGKPTGENSESDSFRTALLLPNLDVVAVYDGFGVIRMDKDSKLLWAVYNGAHHALDVSPSGDLYVLTRQLRDVTDVPGHPQIYDDAVVVLGPDGFEKQRVSIHDAAVGTLLEEVSTQSPGPSADIYHTNALSLIEDVGPQPWYRPGNVLLSFREMNALAVLDMNTGRLVWAWRGPFAHQHDPVLLPEGKLLLFNNRGPKGRSQVLELDLQRELVTWSFTGTDDDPLYSECCGTVQRLPNGDTLIAASGAGRALEVTSKGEIVWDFYIPERSVPEGFIATLFGVRRVDPVSWQEVSPVAP